MRKCKYNIESRWGVGGWHKCRQKKERITKYGPQDRTRKGSGRRGEDTEQIDGIAREEGRSHGDAMK